MKEFKMFRVDLVKQVRDLVVISGTKSSSDFAPFNGTDFLSKLVL